MSQQSDVSLANQGFADFRSELNLILAAFNTNHSGSSRPSSAVAGSFWLDTTSATAPILKHFDGSDDITIMTFNYTANTVDMTDSSVTFDIVNDTSPQLGGQLDVNGQALGDGTLELLKFSETGSAVNEFTIANAASGAGPTLSATGDNTNVDINISAKGSGVVAVSGSMIPSITSTGKALIFGF